MTRRRRLRPEEEDIWQAVARTATPMHLPKAKTKAEAAPPHDIRPASRSEESRPAATVIEPFRVGEKAVTALGHNLTPGLSGQGAGATLHMDAKAFARMSRGKLVPEARIDLHGKTLAEAHPALISFIMNAHSHGMRLVLVITGKGRTASEADVFPSRTGVLKRQVPQWLAQQPMAQAVLQVAEAHLRHGGGGAFYVYLRRLR